MRGNFAKRKKKAMHPILFKIGPFCVYSYGFCVAAAFLVAVFLAKRAAGRAGQDPQIIIDVALVLLFWGIIGARLLYVLLNIGVYIKSPVEIVMLQRGGLAFYGGAVAAVLAAVIFLKKKRLPIYKIADLIVPYAALAQAIGRIGCFLNGCCFGKPTGFFLGVVFPGSLEAVHPTQIYSSLSLIALYGFLRFLQKTSAPSVFLNISIKLREGTLLFTYGLFYSLGRFFIEFLRADNIVSVFGLAFSQFVSIIIFAVCLWKIAALNLKQKA